MMEACCIASNTFYKHVLCNVNTTCIISYKKRHVIPKIKV